MDSTVNEIKVAIKTPSEQTHMNAVGRDAYMAFVAVHPILGIQLTTGETVHCAVEERHLTMHPGKHTSHNTHENCVHNHK